MSEPTPPRYEARALPPEHLSQFGVYDSFTQAFCIGEMYSSMARAVVAAERMSAAYGRAMAP